MKKSYDEKSWSFLISAPNFMGPVFEDSVILLLEDNTQGSFGVVVNKPLEKTLSDLDSSFEGGKLEDIEVFDGGPIDKSRISIAVWYDESSSATASFGFGLKPEKALELLKKNPSARAAAFSGYAGWSADQLQDEIEEGTWIVSDVDFKFLNDIPHEDMWRALLIDANPRYSYFPIPDECAPNKN